MNLILLAFLALAITDILLGRGTVQLVQSQLETFRRLAASSAAGLAEEFAWQAIRERPTPRQVFERTSALHGMFPQSVAEIVCAGDEPAEASVAGLKEFPWIVGDDYVDYVGLEEQVALVAYARRTYGECTAHVIVRRPVDEDLAQRVSEAIGLGVMPAGPVKLSEDQLARAWDHVAESGTALGGGWWPVVLVAVGAETGRTGEWLALQVRPDLMTILGQLSRLGRQRAAWVWVISALTCAVVLVGATSMLLAARISTRIAAAIQDLSEGAARFGTGELTHRIPERGHGQLATLARSVNTMASNLQNLIEEVRRKERLEEEIRLAREVQEWLYPRCVPELPAVELAVHSLPARMVTGDLYDFFEADQQRIGILCADVSGKGIAAALVGASLHSVVRGYIGACLRISTDSASAFPPPAEVLRHASEQLRQRVPAGQYATVFWCAFDPETSALRYCNAGHLYPVLLSPHSNSPTRLSEGGVPAGLLPDASYTEGVLQLPSGSLLVTFSDGITEASNTDGIEFGEERLLRILTAHRDAAPQTVCSEAIDAAREWMGPQEQTDDMTIIALRVR